MPGPRIINFHGMIPRLDGRLLDYAYAILAVDVDLEHGDLMPWRCGPPVKTCSQNIKTIYDSETENGFCCFPDERDFAAGVPSECENLVYWTDTTGAWFAPRDELCNGRYPLGVPCPVTAPVGEGGAEDKTCSTACSYVYTYVNQFGHESSPSAPSALKLCLENEGGVSGLASPPPGYAIDRIRIYRAVSQNVTGDERQAIGGGEFFLVAEVPADTVGVSVTGFNAVTETLVSHRWFPPPKGLSNLTFLPHGVLAGSIGNVVYLSEPHQYHAWPRDNDLVLRDNIVAMREYEGDLYVVTDGHPYYIDVSAQREIGPVYDVYRHPDPAPCNSKPSFAVGSSGAVWSGPDSLFHMKQTKLTSLTENGLFTEDDWRQMSEIRGEVHNGVYYFTSSTPWLEVITGTEVYSWRLSFGDGVYDKVPNDILTALSIRPDLWYENRRGELFYIIGKGIYEWNPADGEKCEYCYVTRIDIQSGLTNLAGAKVIHDQDGYLYFWLTRYKCGRPIDFVPKYPVLICEPFRLPKCYLGIDHYFKFCGTSRTREFHASTSFHDLTEWGGNLGQTS